MKTDKPDFEVGHSYLEELVVRKLAQWKPSLWWYWRPQDLGMYYSYHVEWEWSYGLPLKYYVIDP